LTVFVNEKLFITFEFSFRQVKQDAGQIDILVNNAGIVTGKKFLQSQDLLIEKTMEVNIMAHFWVSSFIK